MEDLIKYVKSNMIPTCNVTREDIICAQEIFGPNRGSLNGKTIRQPTEQVQSTWVSIPKEIFNNYGDVTLAVDNLAINNIPFMVSTPRTIHFGTAKLTRNKTKDLIMTFVSQVIQSYHTREFRVCNLLEYIAFKCFRDRLSEMDIAINVASRNEQILEIEQYIRTVKERVRAIANSLPFKQYLPRLIAEMVYNRIFWLNSFPHKDRVNATISPMFMVGN